MASNNTKNETLNLFLDNVYGNITAADLRTFVSNIFDDKEVVVRKYVNLDAFEIADNSNVFEGSLVVITGSTDAENGLYISLSNQPTSRTNLLQVSNNTTPAQLIKTNYEFVAHAGQFLFNVEFLDNNVDVFVDGSKWAASEIMMSNGGVGIGTVITFIEPLAGGEAVEIICYKEA